jgi:hypothetical protein
MEVQHDEVVPPDVDHQALGVLWIPARGTEEALGIRRARGDVRVPPGSVKVLHPSRRLRREEKRTAPF